MLFTIASFLDTSLKIFEDNLWLLCCPQFSSSHLPVLPPHWTAMSVLFFVVVFIGHRGYELLQTMFYFVIKFVQFFCTFAVAFVHC